MGRAGPLAVPRRLSRDRRPALLPSGQAAIERLLAVFELEKAVYELRYELDNRPDWVGIPVAGIQRLIDQVARARDRARCRPACVPRRARGGRRRRRACVPAGGGDGARAACRRSTRELKDPRGLWEALLPKATLPLEYELEVEYPDGSTYTLRDPYSFLPTLGELDIHLVDGGPPRAAVRAARRARPRDRRRRRHCVRGVGAERSQRRASSATSTRWDGRLHPMRTLGSSGIWELFIPGVDDGRRSTSTRSARGTGARGSRPTRRLRDGGAAGECVDRPRHRHEWNDDAWLVGARARRIAARRRCSIYEVHLGSWRRNPLEDNRPLTYRELARRARRPRRPTSASRTSS